jgi:Spy/CpxP family protein refolding chaperone
MIALMAAMAGANGFAMMAGLAATHAEWLRKVLNIDPKKGKMANDDTFKNIFKGRSAKARMRYSAPPARSSRRRSMGSRPRATRRAGKSRAKGAWFALTANSTANQAANSGK